MINDASSALERIREHLGEPLHASDRHLIYAGDCLDLMRRLEFDLFDLTVTSPPYNIGKEYEEVLGLSEYLDWCEEWMAEVYRLTQRTGAFWLNVGYVPVPERAKALPLPYLLWDRSVFFLLQEIVWNYGAGVASRKSFSPRNEKFLWFAKSAEEYTFDLDAVRDPNVKYPNQKKNGKLKCNPLGKNPSDVWQIPKVTSGSNRSSKERTPHPAQFPLAVVDRIVRACSLPGEIVFDPFLGSGTTLEAALRAGRCAVGFEIREDYARIAAKRVERCLARMKQESAEMTLF